MRVLVLCDDHWHPGATVRTGLAPLGKLGFSFDFVENARDWSPHTLSRYPVVMLSKADNVSGTDDAPWVTSEVERVFLDYVKGGGGLLAVHSGTVYGGHPVLRALLGGVFVEHPPQLPVTVVPRAGHPLTIGVEPFTVQDEHYMMTLDDAEAHVFITTRSEHGDQPGGWTRTEGAGRVCVLTPGHNLDVWLAPPFQRLLERALRWCAS